MPVPSEQLYSFHIPSDLIIADIPATRYPFGRTETSPDTSTQSGQVIIIFHYMDFPEVWGFPFLRYLRSGEVGREVAIIHTISSLKIRDLLMLSNQAPHTQL